MCICLSTSTAVEHWTGCFLHHTDIRTLSCSILYEVIQFRLYRPSLVRERKLNCLSISPTLWLLLCLILSFLLLISPPHLSFVPVSSTNLSFNKTPVLCLHLVLSVYVLLPAVISCIQRKQSLTV